MAVNWAYVPSGKTYCVELTVMLVSVAATAVKLLKPMIESFDAIIFAMPSDLA